MPSIHPSEQPALGWFVPCLAVKDLRASLAFYEKLDLQLYGGNPDEHWAMVRNRAVEIHMFQGHIPKNLLNFRGCDAAVLRAAMDERGFVVSSTQGPSSFIYLDPDGREVFFDTSDAEHAEYESGQPLTGLTPGNDVHEGAGLDLGNLTWCLTCRDVQATRDFYVRLGLVEGGGSAEQGMVILGRVDQPPTPGTRILSTTLTLFDGRIPADLFALRGGNVAAIADALAERGVDLGDGVQRAEDGGESLLLRDPDGHGVFLDTTPPERLYETT